MGIFVGNGRHQPFRFGGQTIALHRSVFNALPEQKRRKYSFTHLTFARAGQDRGRLFFKQTFDEGPLVEHLQFFDFLAHTNVLDRDFKLVGNADGHAALGCAVKLSQG